MIFIRIIGLIIFLLAIFAPEGRHTNIELFIQALAAGVGLVMYVEPTRQNGPPF